MMKRKWWRSLRWKAKQSLAGEGRRYYGDGGTIHHTKHLHVETYKGTVVAVWFRCQRLPFEQVEVTQSRAVEMERHFVKPMLTGVEVEVEPLD